MAWLKNEVIQEQIDAFGGSVQWSGGDSMLGLFDSVVDAVECACRIQSALATENSAVADGSAVRMRIGINFGDIILDGDDVAGESVNLAARLEGLCEPGGLALSGSAYREVHNKVLLPYEEMGQRWLKNIAEPVRVYRVRPTDIDRRIRPKSRGPMRLWRVWRRRVLRPWVPVTASAVVVAAVLVFAFGQQIVPGLLGSPNAQADEAIAVLPFENLSGDADQDHIARGIATDLIVDLSQIESASVVARSSSFRYQQRPVDLEEVTRLLGARYVVEGTVFRRADDIRVNVSLNDASTGRQLWAARFDGSTSQLFAFQHEITNKVLEAVEIKLGGRTRPRSTSVSDFALRNLFFRAREAYFIDQPDQLALAKRLFEETLRLDPNFTVAYAYLAAIYWAGFDRDWSNALGLGTQQTLNLALQNLEQSLKAPIALTYQVQSRVLAWEGDFEKSLEAAKEAESLDPNDPVGRLTMAIALIYAGNPKEALNYLDEASKVDPLNRADYLFWIGLADYILENYENARRALRMSLELNREDDWTHLLLAATLGQLGEVGQAQHEAEIVQDMRRQSGEAAYTLRDVQYWSFSNESDNVRLCEGLAKAGLSGTCN
ncbi:MAG: tetratricopeptide repeat protein [Alphaproteobacteria bacterium]|nr:tetratricopeptide repeat protein [Alphaproteobacteria bacterium]